MKTERISGTADPLELGLEAYSPMEQLLLCRLTRFQRIRNNLHAENISPDDFRWKLVNKALYSDLLLCQEMGIEMEASGIIERMRVTNHPPHTILLPAPFNL